MSGWSRVPAHRRVTVGRLSCIVDGFKFAGSHCTHYFLSHFHSDHYTGLSDTFHHGLIHCSQITARLLPTLGVYPQYIAAHDFDSPFVLEDVQLTLTEANHCPGAALILFQQLRLAEADSDCADDEQSSSGSKRRRISGSESPLTSMVPATTGDGTLLHTGDFRFDEGMKVHNADSRAAARRPMLC
jgi:ribonuclease BN (tRNA processing enzyme)